MPRKLTGENRSRDRVRPDYSFTHSEEDREDFQEAKRQLDRSRQELEQFVYMASHDLQEPLRMVASYTKLLAKRYRGMLDDDADDFISYAVDGADRMQRMIHNMLKYSRVNRTDENEMIPTDCEYVLRDALANLRLVIDESGAVITHDPLPVVMADDEQLVQVFQNLIGNAIKFRKDERPEIHISAEYKKRSWIFYVCDNGTGIGEQDRDRIFQIFQRAHDREKYSGTGIGLAICKKIIEQHGGQIGVRSEPGKGSTFYFSISTGAWTYDYRDN